MVLTIANTKGGVGKSTITIHFAHALKIIQPKSKVVILDADTQHSSLDWGRIRAEAEIEPYIEVQQLSSEKGLKAIIEDKRKLYDYILIDVGGSDNPNLRRSLIHSDLVIVPTSTDPAEVSSTTNMTDLITEAKQEYNQDLACYIIFNNVRPTKERRFVDFFKENFPSYVHWTKTFLMTRVAFSRYYLEGKTVFDLKDDHEDKKAKEEVLALVNEILGVLS